MFLVSLAVSAMNVVLSTPCETYLRGPWPVSWRCLQCVLRMPVVFGCYVYVVGAKWWNEPSVNWMDFGASVCWAH